MKKKDYKNLISTYIQVILGFIGISSSLLIPLLITYYFQYFTITSEVESLSSEQMSYVSNNLLFIIASIFIFISSLFISLFLFAKFSFSDNEINQKRTEFLLQIILAVIITGFVFLVISLGFFLMFFIPNKLFFLGVVLLVVIALGSVIAVIFIQVYL